MTALRTSPSPAPDLRTRYAVAWRGRAGEEASGRLALDGTALVLRGSGADGSPRRERVAYRRIGTVRIGRTGAERVRGERSVVLELRDGGRVSIAPLGAPGAVFELADLVAGLAADHR